MADTIPIQKSKVTAAILAWFFGFLGVHRLYLGKSNAFILFVLGVFGIFAVVYLKSPQSAFFALPALIWAQLDFIYIICGKMTDGDNRPLV